MTHTIIGEMKQTKDSAAIAAIKAEYASEARKYEKQIELLQSQLHSTEERLEGIGATIKELASEQSEAARVHYTNTVKQVAVISDRWKFDALKNRVEVRQLKMQLSATKGRVAHYEKAVRRCLAIASIMTVIAALAVMAIFF